MAEGRDWVLRVALGMVAGGVIAFASLLILAATFSDFDFDGYEALHVVSSPGARRHAVVYRHAHADSSAALDGIWIVEGPAPPVGSRQKPQGRPVAVWHGFNPAIHWKDARIVVAGDIEPGRVLAAQEVGTECYFADAVERSRHLQLCIDTNRVTFVRTRL